MTVTVVNYYSVAEAVSLIVTIEGGIPQPALTRYVIETDRDVPIDLWLSWLDGENDLSCEEAWLQLEPREATPIPGQVPTIP
ncbi:MAG: hypothetical protein H7Y09_08890 [Chitinophagaceae bacterium]|nr:hypothetical protein [Anaerolineae bacterium]